MTAPALEVTDLHTGYGDLKVVYGLSFAVEPGKVIAILGRNGAGKTTALRAISGLNPANTGKILLDGEDITSIPAHKRVSKGIAYVQEGKRVFRQRTVEDNLVIGALSVKISRAELTARIEEAYNRFPILREKRRDAASGLSGGQQQMLAIAQALMSRPKVLLLDEPSGGLAPTIVGDVLNTVKSLVADGLTVVLVEQAMGFALALADDVIVMDLGRSVLSGKTTDEGIGEAIEQAYFNRVEA